MKTLISLVSRWRVIRYIISGGTGVLVNLAILFILVNFFHIWYLFAAVAAFAVSFCVSFLMQKFFTFNDGSKSEVFSQLTIYLGVQLFNLGVGAYLLYASVDIFHFHYLVSQIFILGLVSIYSFFIFKNLIFNPQKVYNKDIMKKVFLLIALIATLIPAFFVIYKVGGLQNWQGVLPRGTTDSLYYYARIHEVVDGRPLVGNPYVYEYREVLSPAFFLPDVISAIPMLLGLPFNIGVLVNIFVWSFIFLILAFRLFRLLEMPRRWAFPFTILLYITSYSFMLRPTVMQIVYPVFLAFLVALLRFLAEPTDRKRAIWLTLVSVATFYVYTYLSYIVLLSLGFVFLGYLLSRRSKELKSLVGVGLFSALLLIPFAIYTWIQMGDIYYFETMRRIGLVYTHIPSMEAYFYGRWVVLGMFITAFISKQRMFWIATGLALLFALSLNLITGVELTLGVHIGRFVILWMVVVLGGLLYEYRLLKMLEVGKVRYIVATLLILLLSLGVLKNVPRGLDFFKFDSRGNDKIADLQSYAAPLGWLDQNVKEESVIWADESISQYIPIMTRHYPLFFHGDTLHSISDREIEDRYLLSRSYKILSLEDIKLNFDLYTGAGASNLQSSAYNMAVLLCESIRNVISSRECQPKKDALSLRGEEYFESLKKRFDDIKQNQTGNLGRFQVRYLIVDRLNEDEKIFSPEKMSEILYDDGRFAILSTKF